MKKLFLFFSLLLSQSGIADSNAAAKMTVFPAGLTFLKISGRVVRNEGLDGAISSEDFLRIVGQMKEKNWVLAVSLASPSGKVWVESNSENFVEDRFGDSFGFHLSGKEIPPEGLYHLKVKTKASEQVHAIYIPKLNPKPAPKVTSANGVFSFEDIVAPDTTDRRFVIGILNASEGWGKGEPLYTEMVEPNEVPTKAGKRIIELDQLPHRKSPLVLPTGKNAVFHLTIQERVKLGLIQFIRERGVMKEFRAN